MRWRLVRGRGFSSAAIGWFGGGGFSHIDVYTREGLLRGARDDSYSFKPDTAGGEIITIPPGYRDRPANYLEGKIHAAVTFELDVTPIQESKYWEFSDKQLGKPYDRRGIFDFAFGVRDWRGTDNWFCSEEVAANAEYADIFPPLYEDANRVDPGDCAFIFSALRAKRKDDYYF